MVAATRKNSAKSSIGLNTPKPAGLGILAIGWRPYALLAILPAAVFGWSLKYGLTYFDDDILLIRQFGLFSDPARLIQIFREPYLGSYFRPVVTLSLMADAMISGQDPWMYHASNLIYHIISVVLVYRLLCRFRLPSESALAGALFFAVHPLVTQAVVWIPGRNDVLAGMFILGSLLAFMNTFYRGGAGRSAVHIILFFAAMLTKETAVIVPVICGLLAIVLHDGRHPSYRWILVAGGWAVVLVLWFVLRAPAMATVIVHGLTWTPAAIITHLPVLLIIPAKLAFPTGLAPYPVIEAGAMWIGGLVTLASAGVLIYRKAWGTPVVWFGVALFYLSIFPSLVAWFTDLAHRFDYLECRAYLAVFGGAAVAAGIIGRMQGRARTTALAIMTVIVLLFSYGSFVYSGTYRDAQSHWRAAVASAPNSPDAHYNLGIALMQDKPAEAIEEYRRAIVLYPGNSDYFDNLGICYGRLGRREEAEKAFLESIRVSPGQPEAHSNLGFLYLQEGRMGEAENELKKAAALQADVVRPRQLLVSLYVQQQRFDDARRVAAELRTLGVMIPQEIERILQSH